MSTIIKPELSKKNPYWIEKHRYYELKHFCLQYPLWKLAYNSIEGLAKKPLDVVIFSNGTGDPTSSCYEAREFYRNRIRMVEKVAEETDPVLGDYILKGVINGVSYDILRTKLNIPCSRDIYYEMYRKFFWLLNKERN